MTKYLQSSLMGLALILSLSLSVFAQSSEHSFGLAPNVQNAKGETAYGEGANLPESLFGYGTDALSSPANSFVQFPFPAGTPFTSLSNGPDWLSGADFGPGGLVYGCGYGTGAAPFTLYSVNPSTGAFSVISSSVNVTGTVTGMGYHEASNTMYLASTTGTTSYLYTINVSNGTTSLIGTVTNSSLLIAIAVNCAGQIYGVDLSDVLLSIDPNTAAGTVIGNIGFDANYAQDADFDANTGVMYLAAYNNSASQGQFRSVDLNTGNTTLVVAWPGSEITGMALDGTCGPPCPVGQPSNPNPPSGSINVPINPGNATWTNGAGTTAVEFWFGPVGNLVQLYNGSPISSYAIPGPLNYNTNYGWKVVCKNDTCSAYGSVWTFRTELDPGTLFIDPFDNLSNWTPVGPLGLTNWSVQSSNNATGQAAPELRFSWTPSFNGASYLKSVAITGPTTQTLTLTLKHYLDWYANPSGSMGIAVTYDDGATYTPLWQLTDPTGNIGPEQISTNFTATSSPFKLALFYNGNSFNIDYWYIDDIELTYVVPVELTSFIANSIGNDVTLNWSTATETNNQGFEIQRSNGGEFMKVDFVPGYGTTTQPQTYQFVDKNVPAGKYTYRLKQIDYNGQFEYSPAVEVNVIGVNEYSLHQNYPNPFNPSTSISFDLATESKVTLRIFDILGQEVVTVFSGNLNAGNHKVDFNAGGLNSGIYFYQIDATGIDGKTFSATKKMILNK
ncbi:T9SS type A sorting domain-containing protein [Ignavibacterium sp.]|jgi:hypothetical protein|uniref:T9SS type A sorting domain-containing protein n=1 Tax=Ignavibacterium sp. TaxID=2651167 RepID=UPI0025C44806|nr:T9SS type A sorting domain-containing protein [Ignavibacterium sp.]